MIQRRATVLIIYKTEGLDYIKCFPFDTVFQSKLKNLKKSSKGNYCSQKEGWTSLWFGN